MWKDVMEIIPVRIFQFLIIKKEKGNGFSYISGLINNNFPFFFLYDEIMIIIFFLQEEFLENNFLFLK